MQFTDLHAALETLATCLNDRYHLDLAKLLPETASVGTPLLVIARENGTGSVTVTVTAENRGDFTVYRMAAWTDTAWHCFGDPFITAEAKTVWDAMYWIWHYVPQAPTT